MKKDKYVLDDRHRDCLEMYQQKIGMSGIMISETLGHSNAWFNQIKKGRISSLKAEDLAALLALFYNTDTENIAKSGAVDKFYNFMLKEQNEKNEISNKDIMKKYAKANCNKWYNTFEEMIDDKDIEAETCELIDKINAIIYSK